MSRTQRFTIPNIMASYGELVVTARDTKKLGERERHNIKQVCWALGNANIKPAEGRIILHIRWIEPTDHRKHAQVAAGAVLIERALVRKGIIKSSLDIEGIYSTFAVNASNPRIEVELEEVRTWQA